MPFTISFRMSMAAGGVSESEEEIIIAMSGTGGTQTVSAVAWTEESEKTTDAYRYTAAYGTTSNGAGGIIVKGGGSGGTNFLEWTDNDGTNWTTCNGTGRTNVNHIKGLTGRTDSNTNGYRWVAHAQSLGYECWYYSNDGKSWSFSNRSSYSQNNRAPDNCWWDDENERWIGIGRTRDIYVSNDGAQEWTKGTDMSPSWTGIGSGSDSTPKLVFGHKVNGSNQRKVVMSNESETLKYIDSNDISGNNQTSCTYHGNASGGNGDYDWGDYGKIDDPTNPGTTVDGWICIGGTAGSGNSARINSSKDGQNFYGIDQASLQTSISRIHWWEDKDLWTLYSSANGGMMESSDYGVSWQTQTGTGNTSFSPEQPSFHVDGNTMKFAANRGSWSGSNFIYSSPGGSTSGNSASLNITGDASAHPGVAQSVTFANGISAADATTQVKALFSGGTIQNYTVTDINSTSFKVVSTATGNETNLSFSTSAGTGGSLGSTLTVTDGA